MSEITVLKQLTLDYLRSKRRGTEEIKAAANLPDAWLMDLYGDEVLQSRKLHIRNFHKRLLKFMGFVGEEVEALGGLQPDTKELLKDLANVDLMVISETTDDLLHWYLRDNKRFTYEEVTLSRNLGEDFYKTPGWQSISKLSSSFKNEPGEVQNARRLFAENMKWLQSSLWISEYVYSSEFSRQSPQGPEEIYKHYEYLLRYLATHKKLVRWHNSLHSIRWGIEEVY